MSADIIDSLERIREMQRQIRTRRDDRNQAIVAARDAGWSLDDLADALGQSRERVRAIEKQMRARAPLEAAKP